MAKRYNVPLIAQPSSDTCWHAAAMMIWQHSQSVTGRQGPMNTLSPAYSANRGIGVAAWARLANKMGMKPIPGVIGMLTSKDIEDLLVRYGPLWCCGFWYGVGHAIVITGVDGDTVYLNDPDRGIAKVNTVDWFNLKLIKDAPGSVLYKDPTAY